jgi:hypothetical protein
MLLFWATLIIIVDVRVPSLDIVADAIGGVLVVVAALRIHGAIEGADSLRSALVVLALLALPVTFVETIGPVTGTLALLALTQLLGTIVLARLLADALGRREPVLAAQWHTGFRLLIWLALVPFVAAFMVGMAAPGASIQSPVVIVLIVVVAIPLVWTLRALWRTAATPAAVELPAA